MSEEITRSFERIHFESHILPIAEAMVGDLNEGMMIYRLLEETNHLCWSVGGSLASRQVIASIIVAYNNGGYLNPREVM